MNISTHLTVISDFLSPNLADISTITLTLCVDCSQRCVISTQVSWFAYKELYSRLLTVSIHPVIYISLASLNPPFPALACVDRVTIQLFTNYQTSVWHSFSDYELYIIVQRVRLIQYSATVNGVSKKTSLIYHCDCSKCWSIFADRTNGRAYATTLRQSVVVVCNVM